MGGFKLTDNYCKCDGESFVYEEDNPPFNWFEKCKKCKLIKREIKDGD